MIVETFDLTKKYDKHTVVNAINIQVRDKEIFGFLGPNGAGKTTTIHMLCTLLRPTAGTARVAGYDIIQSPAQVRNNIGLVFQDTTLDENLTAMENLMFHGMIYGISGKPLKNRIEEVMKISSLWERRDDLVKKFSGGMKRRLEIARGLIHFPKVLFLDEPTLGLDPQTRLFVWEYIREMREQFGVSIFMTTHYMDETENCDRISIIDDGNIIACDTPVQLKREIKGDTIYIKSLDTTATTRMIRQYLSLEAVLHSEDTVTLEVEDAETMLPLIMKAGDKLMIEGIRYEKPTLDEVFIKLTGKGIREKENTDKMRHWRRRR